MKIMGLYNSALDDPAVNDTTKKNNNNKTGIFFVLSNVCFLFIFLFCSMWCIFNQVGTYIVKYKKKWDGNPIV